MDFRTTISLRPSAFEINLETQVLSIGSCFSNCMGIRLLENKFKVIANPFGTIFNPLSIFRLLSYAVTGSRPPEETYVSASDVWKNLDFHSEFSATDKNVLEEMISTAISNVGKEFAHLSYLLITPGTAMVYETKKANYLVANCHKLPPDMFYPKRLLEVEEIIGAFEMLKQHIEKLNPNIRYIFTVSPVRHLKDTLELNSWSKSVLLLAVKKLAHSYENVEYFPSYEIMMDDLRDYRFYNPDMLHPSSIAEDYIWEKFAECYFRDDTVGFLKKWAKIKEALAHRPFHPESPSHQRFILKTISNLSALDNIVDVAKEMEILNARLYEKPKV